MAKLIVILVVGLVFEATGVVFLKKGLVRIGELDRVTASEILRVARKGVTDARILLGVVFEAVFFLCLLFLMSKGAEISFIWPLTALGFVFTTFAARFILDEKVSLGRWIGVMLIMAGAALITWSEKTKPVPGPQPVSQAGAPGRL